MTDFRQDKAIYLQIADNICDRILSGQYVQGDRIPSVRELSVLLEVNTNTIVRTYDFLTRNGIIYTKRGMGFYVSDDARDLILNSRRTEFMDTHLPELFRQMKLLDIPIDAITEAWKQRGL